MIKRNKKGQFVKGSTVGNTSAKGNPPNITSFKKGSCHGPMHLQWKGGVQKAGKDCAYLWEGANKRLRRPRVIYEKIHGKIQKGFVIFHKNGDTFDDSIQNLEAISRQELIKRNRKNSDLLGETHGFKKDIDLLNNL